PRAARASAIPSPMRLAAPVINASAMLFSVKANAAGYVEARAGDITGALGHQECHRLADIDGASEAPERREPDTVFLALHTLHLLPRFRARFDAPGRDRV